LPSTEYRPPGTFLANTGSGRRIPARARARRRPFRQPSLPPCEHSGPGRAWGA
jgi:hypothetical protein